MTREDRISGIFLKACALAPGDRAAFLDKACAGDSDLRAEVEAVLAADARAEAGEGTDALAARVGRIAADAAASARAPLPLPERIGPYRILELLGEGGMGVVYRAEQTEPVHREVALKLVRMAIDSAGAVARFESERQALAMMDHPNIARLLDAGATGDGRPYFVMELVRGVPITEYCKAGQLGLRERVLLFQDVCRAVRHAHRHGVIHRDLKPSNILITQEVGQPVPKVIDFSIAKALGEPALGTEFRTRTGQLIGTLEYMSPEQALGRAGAIDTRSDVYALGVILHELIAERLPHDVAGQPLLEAVRRIAEDPPRSLRGTAMTTTGRLDADLETIAGKCLEKEPDRRYGSAAELVEDLERYLCSRPIQARPPSTVYQLRKLVARHRALFAAAALLIALFLVFSITVTIQLGIQRRERARAESQAAKAERVIEFMQKAFAAASSEMGYDATVKQALDRAAKELASGTTDEPEADAAIRLALAQAYLEFQETEKSQKLSREAIALLESQLGPLHQDVGSAYQQLGASLFHGGKVKEALAEGEHALTIHEAQERPNPVLLGQDLSLLGSAHGVLHELDVAEAILRREIGLYETEIPRNDKTLQGYATAKENLADVLQRGGHVAKAAVLMGEVLEVRRKFGGDLGVTVFNVAYLLNRQGKHAEAEPLFRESVEFARRQQGPRHPAVADRLRGLGEALQKLRRLEEAEAAFREALAILGEAGKKKTLLYGGMLGGLAALLSEQDRLSEAERLAREGLEITKSVVGEEHAGVAGLWARLGAIFEAGGRLQEAEEAFRTSVAMREKVLAPDDIQVGFGLNQLATFLAGRRRFQEAFPLHERAFGILKTRLDEDSPELVSARGWRALILDGLGRYPEAEEIRMDAMTRTRKIYGDDHPSVGWLLHGRAAALRRQGRFDDALPVAREAVALRRRLRGQDKAIAESLLELAESLSGRGETQEAGAAASDALAIWSKATFADPVLLERARAIAARAMKP